MPSTRKVWRDRQGGAGRYQHLLTFQRKTIAYDHGAEVPTWADEFQEYGSVESGTGQPSMSAREFWNSTKRYAETTIRFAIRWRDGIDAANHRIVHNGKAWDIQPPYSADGRDIELIIEAKESQ